VTLLDAYAVIGFLADEPVAHDVDLLIRRGGCRMTALGLAEVIDRMARLYDADPDEIAVDIAALGLESPTALDATSSVPAGRLRARHYHRTTRAVSMADCVLAAEAQVAGEAVATFDPHLLGLCRDEGISAIALPGSDGSVWSPA
jgi:PIN domain nuclease of toxin-antitoxin system